MERFMIMKITEVKKKNGATVYRASVYLGVDRITGKKIRKRIKARSKKELRKIAVQEKYLFEKIYKIFHLNISLFSSIYLNF